MFLPTKNIVGEQMEKSKLKIKIDEMKRLFAPTWREAIFLFRYGADVICNVISVGNRQVNAAGNSFFSRSSNRGTITVQGTGIFTEFTAIFCHSLTLCVSFSRCFGSVEADFRRDSGCNRMEQLREGSGNLK